MNLATALCVAAAVVGLLVAVLSQRFGSAPGWGRYRALAAVGVTAAVYSALDTTWTTNASRWTLGLALGVQGCFAALHVAAWHVYVRRHLALPRRRADSVVMALLFVIGALWLVPGLLGGGRLLVIEVPWLGVTYRLLETTAGGGVAYVLTTALLGVPFVRYLYAMRRGVPDARLHALAIGAVLAAGGNDTLVSLAVIQAPMVLSFGFVVAVGALGYSLTRAFVGSARELDRLSRSLEQLVAERTRALVAAEASLLKTEKMAALGQLAAGVAHEINNPAAAVEANLAYLRDALDAGGLPHDGRECLDESLEAVARIAKIVGKLLDAGRSATKDPASSGTASVQLAVEEAMMTSRPHVGEHITTTVDLSSALYVRADAPSLVQVLVNLIVNAAQAIPVERGHGHVQIRTSSTGGRIAIQVIDDGTGMSDETKRRLFEPFFTTKPMDEGTGLGLAVSLGLLRAMGGDLEVASAPGSTCMTILLDAEL